MEVVWDDLPLLPGVLECVGQGIIPGSVERNRESSLAAVKLGSGVTPIMLDVCMDAQTSGGLLISVAGRKAAALLKRLHEAGIAEAAVIGKVRGKGRGRIFLETRGDRPITEIKAGQSSFSRDSKRSACCSSEESSMPKRATESPCCAAGHGSAPPAAPVGAGVADLKRKFGDFMKATEGPGSLDPVAKQAVAIALAVHARCHPCVKHHIQKALRMGFTQDQVDEAAWIAIAFGGSPVMMFYEGVRKGE
jgi:AhpD family alkylhydroperoxidase